MAANLQAVAYWGPITNSISFQCDFAAGIQPSTFRLRTVLPSTALPNIADLTFYQKDSNGNPIYTFTLPDCLLENPQLDVTTEGQFLILPLQDRRWKWRFGYIDGSYNVPEPNGITFKREKTPQELATLLLDAMGEDVYGYDVTRLPDDTNARPHKEWESANPASELDQLCQEFDCFIILNPLTNKVEIWPEGEGASDPNPPLPSNQPYTGLAFADVYPAQPTRIIMEAATTLFDMVFRTEAVGQETDGTWKPINDLSYTPAAGWGNTWPAVGFKGIEGTYTKDEQTLELSDLAESSVFRNYRFTGLVDGGKPSEGIYRQWAPALLTNHDTLEPQIYKDLKVFDSLATYDISAEDGSIVPLQALAFVKGEQTRRDLKRDIQPETWPYGFSIDTFHGIAKFGQPLFRDLTSFYSGTAQSGDATHIQLAASASSTDNFHTGDTIEIVAGTGYGQSATFSGYVGATRTGAVASWSHGINPDSTSRYEIYKSGPSTVAPAIVRIRCSFYAGKDGVFHRHFVETDTGSEVDTPSRLDKHKEIQRIVIAYYNNTSDVLTGTINDNEDDCNDRLNYWLDAAGVEYGLRQGGTASYVGLIPLSPDGLIQQITWSDNTTEGPKTIASAAQRHNRYVPSLDNQRHELLVPELNQKITDTDKALRTTGSLERLAIA